MVSSYLLEYFMLVLDSFKLLAVVSLQTHYFQRVQITSLHSPHKIHLPKGPLSEELQQLEVLKRD